MGLCRSRRSEGSGDFSRMSCVATYRSLLCFGVLCLLCTTQALDAKDELGSGSDTTQKGYGDKEIEDALQKGYGDTKGGSTGGDTTQKGYGDKDMKDVLQKGYGDKNGGSTGGGDNDQSGYGGGGLDSAMAKGFQKHLAEQLALKSGKDVKKPLCKTGHVAVTKVG